MNENRKRKGVIELICIAASYIILYGIFAIVTSIFDDSGIVFGVFAVIFAYFAFKAFKVFLLNSLSSLPWPIYILLLVVLSILLGFFVAPYYIGKWVAEKVNEYGEVAVAAAKSVDAGYSEAQLRKMSIQEIKKLYDNVIRAYAPYTGELETKRINVVYGCKTVGELGNLIDLLAKVHNEKLEAKK